MKLYRIVPYVKTADPHAPGGPFYIPSQGVSRLDNPELYDVLYLCEDPVGCVAEAFGRLPIWSQAMLKGPQQLSGSVQSLVTFGRRSSARGICDLDDAAILQERSLRPSHVITRRYEVTQAWAKAIFSEQRWSGARWWSYYEAAWSNVGLWDRTGLKVESIEPLRMRNDVLARAAEELSKPVIPDRQRT